MKCHERSDNVKISIIVPIYNAAQYLQACIDSLVDQTWKDIEIILINDGSTDNSEEICKTYLSDSRVIYRYQKNAGVSAARNAGLSLATGEYICFVDSDDWLELDALERLQNETADIVIYNFFHGEKKHCSVLTDGTYTKEDLFPKMISYIDTDGNVAYVFHTLWIRLFKKKLVDEHHIRFDPRFHNGEDLLFTLAGTMKASSISVRCSEYLYHYRPTPNSQTTSYIKNYWILRKQIIDEIYNLIDTDILRNQMPLRIFSWAVAGIENELRHPHGSQERIREIVFDPICDMFKGKLDTSQFNKKNKAYYEKICHNDAYGIWVDYQQQIRNLKRKKAIKQLKRRIRKIVHLDFIKK